MNGSLDEWQRAAALAEMHSPAPCASLALLAHYVERYGASSAADFLRDQLDSHPNCINRQEHGGHITASVLIFDGVERFVLTHHRRYGSWQQLGGHADGNYDLAAVAAREGLEESGLPDFLIDPTPIDIDIHAAGCPPGSSTRHFDVCFQAVASRERKLARSEESLDLRWIRLSDFAALGVSPRVGRMARQIAS